MIPWPFQLLHTMPTSLIVCLSFFIFKWSRDHFNCFRQCPPAWTLVPVTVTQYFQHAMFPTISKHVMVPSWLMLATYRSHSQPTQGQTAGWQPHSYWWFRLQRQRPTQRIIPDLKNCYRKLWGYDPLSLWCAYFGNMLVLQIKVLLLSSPVLPCHCCFVLLSMCLGLLKLPDR